MVKTVFIFGGPDEEHLRAERVASGNGPIIVLISHEVLFTKTETRWRDRNLAAMPLEAWERILEELKEG